MAMLELRIDPNGKRVGHWFHDGEPVLASSPDFESQAAELAAISQQFREDVEQKVPRFVEPAALSALGKRLFDVAFAPAWAVVAERLGGGPHTLVLRCSDPMLLNLPWELVEMQPDLPLGCDPRWAFLRLPLPADVAVRVPLPDPGPIRLQFLAAAPTDSVPLDFEREEDGMLRAIGTLSKEVIVLPFAETGGIDELAALVGQHCPHLVHLSGHGVVDPNGIGHFGFEDERGHSDLQPVFELMNRVFRGSATRCVVLNACQTAKAATAGLAQKLVESGIPLVIGWAASVADDLATAFIEVFYKHLAKGEAVPLAIARAREHIWRRSRVTVGQQQLIDATFTLPQVYALGSTIALYDRTASPQKYEGPKTVPFLLGDGIKGLTEGFIGRRMVQQELIPALRDGGITFAVLHGMGGMGKSTLATRAANRLTEAGFKCYPVRASGGEAPEQNGAITLQKLRSAVSQALLEAGETEGYVTFENGKIPFELRLGVAVSALCSHRAVFVLDKFEDVLDVATLHIVHPELSAAYQYFARNLTRGSRVLVTCRFLPADTPTDTPTVWSHSLDELSDSEFFKFLRRDDVVEGRMQRGELPYEWLEQLHKTIGQVPGFLDQVRAVLRTADPDQLTDDTAADGSSLEQKRQKYYEGIFLPKLYDQLTPNGQRLCSRLAVSELPLPHDGLAGLLERGQAEAETAARNGADYGLLVAFETGLPRTTVYHPPGLLRVWLAAPARLTGSESRQCHRFLATYWRNTLESRRDPRSITPGDAELQACLSHSRTAQDLQTQMWAACQISSRLFGFSAWELSRRLLNEIPVSQRDATTWQLLGSVELNTGDYPAARSALSQAITLFRAVGEKAGEATTLHELSGIELKTGDYSAAKASTLQVLALWRAIGDKDGEATSLHQLGSIQLNMGDYSAATTSLTEALEVFRTIGNKQGQATALHELGGIGSRTGDYPTAKAALAEALNLLRAIGNKAGEAHTLDTLGGIEIATGDFSAAKTSLTQAITLFISIGDKAGEARTRSGLGHLYVMEGNFPKARSALTQALAQLREIDDRPDEAYTLHELGHIYSVEGDPRSARTFLTQALALRRAIGDQPGEAATLNSLGSVDMHERLYADARANFQQSLAIRQANGDKAGEARTLHQLGALAWKIGQRRSGAGLAGMSVLLKFEIGADDAQRSLQSFAAMCEQLGFTSQEEVDNFVGELRYHYHSDGGREWIREAFSEAG